ncbi:hypothetical protein Fcan01_27425 [Folsomia candida]|uniref:Uncharacterized protein n=1 Tax=Folsomia candida TaxID=158441 RepID=A0A226CWP7_FOLCA|nr:hypothetical protein Fcan01_27425 [Folsomia candida]
MPDSSNPLELYDDAHQKLVRLEKGAETSAAEGMDESRTKVPPKRKRRISQTKIQNKSSDEEVADMESESDDGYPKLVDANRRQITAAKNVTSSQNSSGISMARKSITPVRSVNEDRGVNTPWSSQTVSISRTRLIDYDDSTLTLTQTRETFEKQMIRKVDFLTASVLQLNDSVQLLLNRQNYASLTSTSARTNQFNFPIANLDDWKALEEKLKLGERSVQLGDGDKHMRVNEVKDSLVILNISAVRLIIPASNSKDTDEAIKYYLKKAPARIASQNKKAVRDVPA